MLKNYNSCVCLIPNFNFLFQFVIQPERVKLLQREQLFKRLRAPWTPEAQSGNEKGEAGGSWGGQTTKRRGRRGLRCCCPHGRKARWRQFCSFRQASRGHKHVQRRRREVRRAVRSAETEDQLAVVRVQRQRGASHFVHSSSVGLPLGQGPKSRRHSTWSPVVFKTGRI